MKLSRLTPLISLLVTIHYVSCLDDLIAEESQAEKQVSDNPKRYSSRIRASDNVFGQKTAPKKTVLDFRIEPEALKAAAAGAGKDKREDEEEKTLAQQVADGKYGLIQNELFPDGSKRPGIISYKNNPEVPKDTEENLGGLDKEEIWLAEDHVLVLRGGGFPSNYNETHPSPWSPIDDYVAPTRQVEIPKNPKIPPPFPVQLSENGPLQFIRGENGSQPPPPPFFPPFPFPPPGANSSFPFPVPPGASPPFLPPLPPGAMFLPPPGNMTEFDEDDPSIYYPPKYDFYYPLDNSSAVPAGPLVPGIILPPPPNFFAPERPNDEENETENDVTTKKPYVAPAYLPVERRPYKQRTTKRPPVVKTTTVFPVYTEKLKTTTPPGFTSPIYVPNTPPKSVRGPRPTTSPRPNHISIPKNKTLKQDIYIISTEPPDVANDIIDLIRDTKPTKSTTLEGISPERHPLRSLIRPQVSVNYIGKVGHLPPSTAFPFPRTEPTPTDVYTTPHGHFITVTPVPVVSKVQIKPTESPQNSHATFFYFEEPTTPSHENDVSASPLDDFIKNHFKEDAPDYLKDIQPVYIPAKKHKSRPRPVYFTPEESDKLNALEIDNTGLSGLHTLPTAPPREPTRPPQKFTVPTTDSPFIPSNYYATANPANMHFTKFDPSIVDDITMKYFTIFGQKLGAGTTPIPSSTPTTPRTKIVEAYTPSTTPRPKIYTKPTSTEPPRPISITTSRPTPHSYIHVSKPPRPNFEQFLQEITGEDQSDYIVTHKSPVKIKKPKSRPVFNEPPAFQQYYTPYHTGGFSDYLENIYRQPSTTLKPVSNVQIQPQYLPSTTLRPFTQTQPPQRGPKPLSHNFGQFLQEVTYSGSNRPPSGSNLQFFDASAHNPVRQKYQKPVSLESDVLVNYRQPLPQFNPDAELLPTSYASSQSNIKVVNAPDLTRNRQYTQHYRPRPQFDNQKPFFSNLPNSGYFGAQQSNNANAFVAYNLPGNGGHFYFLTPQALDRSDSALEDEEERFGTVKRSDEGPVDRLSHRRTRERDVTDVSSSQEYLRRRRKKSR